MSDKPDDRVDLDDIPAVLKSIWAAVFVVALGSAAASAQTQPTQAEIDAWAKAPNAPMETSPCKKMTWLLEAEKDNPEHPIHFVLGWWGRGFVEGALFGSGNNLKAAKDFGLSVDVVAAHLTAYCYGHQAETPFDAILDLVSKVSKTAK